MLVPKLRFKREDGTSYPEWKTNELKTVFPKIRNGFVGTVSDSFADKKTGIRYIEGTNIHNGIISDDVEIYVTKAFHGNHPNSQLKADDIVMVQSGHIGDCAVVGEKYAGSNCHALIIMSNGGHCDSRFYSFYFHCDFGYNKMKMYMQGNTVKHILASDMQTFIVPIPDLEEQQKIADFLSAVDEVIAQSQAEVQNLEQQKKAAMQKIFSQEVRFKKDDGTEYPEWEEKRMGDILTLCHGKDYKHLENGDIPVMGTGGVITYVNKALCDWECVCIGRKGTIDKPYFMDKPFWSVDTLFYSKPLGNNMPKFQYYLFQNINWYFYNEASGVPSLSASTIENIKAKVPCLEEQQKIADFLSAYDEAITYAKQELEQWKQLKKGLLQQMFV